MKRLIALTCITVSIFACKNEPSEPLQEEIAVVEVKPNVEFGFNLDDYTVKRDTVKSGDSFGEILERNRLGYPEIFQIAEKTKDSFDVRRLTAGKPYTILFSKDSLQKPERFIYQPTKEDYVVVSLTDSIHAYTKRKPITYIEKEASGVIPQGSGISMVMQEKGLSQLLANKMANEIFAWTIDFNRVQPGDRFKVIYTDKYIDDSIYSGVDRIKAVYFEHNKEPFYAFEFETDSVKGIIDYFNHEAKNLRRAFLKSPLKFGRISSKYDLKRRIAHYGYRVKAHRGTDFAAANGTPILATANGTVTKASYTRGNGKYVKLRHNATYETQYLHMSRRNVKVGQFVKQGDVIGFVGNTGSSAGNHVCYRFWKNGKQVDPFKQKLPEAKPISDSLKAQFLEYISPIKFQLDNITVVEDVIPAEEIQPEISEIQ
ncbi:peptidoglycan DD-metalloendopeptidase family protein [Winogradskyella maritima]|uniref:Peptidoglycan DD-metalloendopeptidase family protein n=1 Tax=Winogradskyella maritima TaxID=1517766 RepID=A0ABV8AHC1_9FLAO|nr:peptidoglycan DD-metalloendopeptidase family protein [Winogradskyella maritima]